MDGRRRALLTAALGLAAPWPAAVAMNRPAARLFLCGDLMTGRGIDQILPQTGDPRLYENWVRDARRYVEIAEEVSGPIARPVAFEYIWGDALARLDARQPALRIVNLETSVTTHDQPWPDKGINYRMHPGNLRCLGAAAIDCCVLANNHVLDWGRPGLDETLTSLRRAGLAVAGAGTDRTRAEAPAALPLPDGRRLLVFAAAGPDCGVPPNWAATGARAGLAWLPDYGAAELRALTRRIAHYRRDGDIVLMSLHWGGNWGYAIPAAHRDFAHGLVDQAGVDLVHGHSSHHPRAAELYRGRLILYGCGDLLNDYEGIGGHEECRGDLGLLYFPELEARSGRLAGLELAPTQIRRLQLSTPVAADRRWLRQRLAREYGRFGLALTATRRDSLQLALPAET